MRRVTRISIVAGFALVTSAAGVAGLHLFHPAGAPPSPLASLLPQGALLEIEAEDLSALVRGWSSSHEKEAWLRSDNYEVFSRSRLYLKLDQSRREFASAAGFPPDMDFLGAVAGSESALAIYDIGKLEFVYITRIPLAKVAGTLLWKNRGRYETRDIDGQMFYIRTDLTTHRTVAFAATPEYLLLATREDLLAGALKLVASNHSDGTQALSDESWWSVAAAAAADAEKDRKPQTGSGPPADVRMVLNLQALARSPYFRSYWIHDNAGQLRGYVSAECDAFMDAHTIREQRVFVRSGAAATEPALPPAAAARALANLVARVPQAAGFYQGWAAPGEEQAVAELGNILAPRVGSGPESNQAPSVNLGTTAGSAADLESRIDQSPPPLSMSDLVTAPLKALLVNDSPQAMLDLAAPVAAPGAALPDHGRATLIEGATTWDAAAVQGALQESIEGLWTTSRLGINWVKDEVATGNAYHLDGLAPLAFATRGTLLAVANQPDLLRQALADAAARPPENTSAPLLSQAAGLRLDVEREPYRNTVRMIDYAEPAGGLPGTPGPRFFSFNVDSLLSAAARVSLITITTHETEKTVQQTVIYTFSGK